MLHHQTRRHLRPHVGRGSARMFAAQPERFEEALARRRHIDTQLAQIVADDGAGRRWMLGRFVLDDFQRPQPRALVASATDEQPAVGRGRKQRCARRLHIGMGIEIMCDADRMPEDRSLDITRVIDIDAAHELDQLASLRTVMRSFGVDRFADQMNSHRNYLASQMRDNPSIGVVGKNYHACEMRDNYEIARSSTSVPQTGTRLAYRNWPMSKLAARIHGLDRIRRAINRDAVITLTALSPSGTREASPNRAPRSSARRDAGRGRRDRAVLAGVGDENRRGAGRDDRRWQDRGFWLPAPIRPCARKASKWLNVP